MPDDTLAPLKIAPYWESVEDNLLQIVDLIPGDKFNWTPKPELWNSRGILIHVSDARNRWLTRDVQDGEDGRETIWTTARTPEDLKSELALSFARLNRFLASRPQLDRDYVSDWDGRTYDGHWIAFHLLEHDIHHRAELLQRLALLDIDHGIDI